MHVHVEILHPAHVHFFKNFIGDMGREGHTVTVTSRDKDVTLALLESSGIHHRVLSGRALGAAGLARELASRTRKLVTIVRRERPDVLTGIMGPTIALAGRLTRTPAVVFYDTETSVRTNPWVFRMATQVCTPESYRGAVPEGRHVTYPGYHELAYLHPDRFTPDPLLVRLFGVEPGESFAFVRFVSWEASHDLGDSGIGWEGKRRLVEHLGERLGRVLVSHEGDLPDGIPGERITGPIQHIHHLLSAATIVVGDSATMSSEAAVLGTPAVFVSPVRLGYLLELESRYGLVVNLDPDDVDEVTGAIDSLLVAVAENGPAEAVARLREETVDVTSWMVELFERRAMPPRGWVRT